MAEHGYRAVFMRGGTSKALMFDASDLPERSRWDPIFLGAMGSPDPYMRQMNGMGGGISSLSKVCVMQPSARDDADVDYTFAQVMIDEARVDYRGNCGNMIAAIGPYAIEQGMLRAVTGASSATCRVFNTNTGKIIEVRFPLKDDGAPDYEGDLEIPGISGVGAPIEVRFLDPGGATTGRLLPTGNITDMLESEAGAVEVSMIDAANACVFVRAVDVGLAGSEMPARLDEDRYTLSRLAALRRLGSVKMGIANSVEDAAKISTVPYVAFVSPPADYVASSGIGVPADAYDLGIRVISNGQPHRACPLTIALCTAVAARIDGSIAAQMLPPGTPRTGPVRIGTPAGVLTVAADVAAGADGQWEARAGTFFRTARKLFEGKVWART